MEDYLNNKSYLKHISKIQRVSLTLFFCLLVTNSAFARCFEMPPKIVAVTPADGSLFYENATVLIYPTVLSNRGCSALEYQFSIDGVIKQAWSTLSRYTWVTTPEDCGSHIIKVEVRNRSGQDSKEVEVYILRKPIPPPE